jgi:hypothetical protein
VLSVTLARALRDGGLRWDPAPGDRFVVADRDMDDEVFTLAEMTVEVHDIPDGQVLGFNGTVEWALDSVQVRDALWLPSEAQLRVRLGATFRRLEPVAGEWQVVLSLSGEERAFRARDAADAYGRALLYLIVGD